MGRSQFSSGRGGGGGRRGGRGGGRGGRGGGGRGRGNQNGSSSSYNNFRGPGYTDGVAKSVDESGVGIKEFLAPDVVGFHGTIKERYSDFIVREVALNGAVAQLTDVKRFTSARAKGKEQKVSELFKQRVFSFLNDAAKRDSEANGALGQETAKMAIPPAIHSLVGNIAGRLLGMFNQNKRLQAERLERANIAQLKVKIVAICGDETAAGFEKFMLRVLDEQVAAQTAKQNRNKAVGGGFQPAATDSKPSQEQEAFFFPEIATKDGRTAVHECIREFGENLVVSDTVADKSSDTSLIRVRRMTVGGKKRKDVDQRGKNKWPSDRPDFLQFVLYKRNLETNSVMSQLAKAMGVNVSAFSYAGTKDKRGITTQFCTLYRGSMERLEMLNRAGRDLETFNFVVGNAAYVPRKLNLGDLQGNRFSLAIRSLPGDDVISDEQIHAAVDSWSSRGFINYFGLQRFGTKSIPTHEIGRAILQRDYKLVVDLVMKPQEGDASKIAEARQRFQENQDVDAALKALPPYLIAERAVLQGLQTYGLEAYAQAIQCIPRHLRMVSCISNALVAAEWGFCDCVTV